jgi:hypothetical protein
VEGDRAAVESWTTMIEDGKEITLAGCVVLRLAEDGRVRELREYWAQLDDRRAAPEDWGL